MSERGRDVVRWIDQAWRALQARGVLLPFEQARIRAGDYSALTREVEPAFSAGDVHAISWSRPQASIEPVSGSVLRPPPEAVMIIRVGKPVRKARGGWSVPFDVIDRRHRGRMMRRRPPPLTGEKIFTTRSDDASREESEYTTNPRLALDDVEAVDDETLAVFAAEAEVKRITSDSDLVHRELARISRLPARQRIVELHKLASDRGVDLRDDVKAFERRIARRLGNAA